MLSYGRLLTKTQVFANARVTVAKRTKTLKYYPILGQSYNNPKRVKEEAVQAALKSKMVESIKNGTYEEEKAEAERQANFEKFVTEANEIYSRRAPVSMIKVLQNIRNELASKQSSGLCHLNFKIASPINKINIKSQVNLVHDNGEVIKNKSLVLVGDLKEVSSKYLEDKENYYVTGIDTLNQIITGEFDASSFERCYASTTISSKLGAAAKILGPLGLMPSAKRGTVGKDINEVIASNSSSLQRKIMIDTEGPEFLTKTVQMGNVNNLTDVQILENVISVRNGLNKSIETHNVNSKKNLIFMCSLTFECDKFEPVEIEYTKK